MLGWASLAIVATIGAGCGGQAFVSATDRDGAAGKGGAAGSAGAVGSGGAVDAASDHGSGLSDSGACAAGELWCPDCFGSGFCFSGACPALACPAGDASTPPTGSSRCPQAGDHLVYRAVDSLGVTFENQTDHRIYVCPSLGWDNPNDTYDCKSFMVGLQVVVIATGLSGSCSAGAGATFGNIGLGLAGTEETCAYLNCRFGN